MKLGPQLLTGYNTNLTWNKYPIIISQGRSFSVFTDVFFIVSGKEDSNIIFYN